MSKIGARKEYRPLVKVARKQGWIVELTNNNHLRFVPPGDADPVVTSNTPSDQRAAKNLQSKLRRHGLILNR